MLLLLTLASVYYLTQYGPPSFLSSLSLPESLKDVGFSPDSSRAGRVAQAKANADVREIDALLHFITAHPERKLDEDGGSIRVKGLGSVQVDADNPVDLQVYSPDGNYEWDEHLKRLKEQYPLVVFSKTYCPYSKRAKDLLISYDMTPPPKVIELNVRSDGPQVQAILARLTGRRTVPNIILKGSSIGGSDDIAKLHDEHRLKRLLEEAGLTVKGPSESSSPPPQTES
ncbi:thioredoxin-like protein [Ganoderma leucocontextum]|nr:thioredoxin-like protein [Ganoderma leucocontextum]